jgi:hypothetical protein
VDLKMKRLKLETFIYDLYNDIGKDSFARLQMKIQNYQARAIRNNIVDQILELKEEVSHETTQFLG